MPDALFLLKIRTADGKTKGGTLVPLFRLLRSATGVKPADLQPVAPVLTSQQRLRRAQGNQPTGKVAQLLVVFSESFPVYPGDLAVLTIAVIIALLRPAKLIACQQHRRAVREEERGEEVALLPLAGGNDIRVFRRPLFAVVIRPVIVMSVVIIFPVIGVMFLVVRYQVVQREAVMRGDKIDAGPRTTPAQIV